MFRKAIPCIVIICILLAPLASSAGWAVSLASWHDTADVSQAVDCHDTASADGHDDCAADAWVASAHDCSAYTQGCGACFSSALIARWPPRAVEATAERIASAPRIAMASRSERIYKPPRLGS